MKELIRKLVEAWGPAGYEHQVRDLIRAEVEPYADEITVDGLGNLIVRVGQGGKKIMVAAHMDEIGVMVTFVEKKTGVMRFTPLGGLLNTSLVGGRVKFEDGTIGVIGAPDMFGAGRSTQSELDSFFIDVSDSGDASHIQPGMPAILWRTMEERGSRLIAKSMDDRIGCVVAVETIKRLNKQTPNELYFVFTVQEEVGIRGARTAAYGVAPDVGIALDVTPTGDLPDNPRNDVKVGGGAAVKLLDTQHIVPMRVREWMLDRAERDGITIQREMITLGTTDAAMIQLARSGVPSGAISIPTRFVHTTSETVDINDVEACVRLLQGLLANPVEL